MINYEKNNILSFVITTKNRCETIKESLSHHCAALKREGLENIVKIIIVDNGSTDNTLDFLRDFCLYHENILVISNGYDIGFDKSLLVGLESSKSRYVWCLQDHALVLIEELKSIISLLEKLEIEYSYVFAPLQNIEKLNKIDDKKLHVILRSDILNSNIFNRELFLHYYKKHIVEFGGSGLVFFLANVEMVISYGIERMLILDRVATIYQHFQVLQKGTNDRWQKSHGGYITVSVGYAKIIKYFIGRGLLSEAAIKRHLAVNDNGLNALHAFIKFRNLFSVSNVSVETAQIITGIPNYSYIEKLLISEALCGSRFKFAFLKVLDFPLVVYLKAKKWYSNN